MSELVQFEKERGWVGVCMLRELLHRNGLPLGILGLPPLSLPFDSCCTGALVTWLHPSQKHHLQSIRQSDLPTLLTVVLGDTGGIKLVRIIVPETGFVGNEPSKKYGKESVREEPSLTVHSRQT